jgi:hypothetical protein
MAQKEKESELYISRTTVAVAALASAKLAKGEARLHLLEFMVVNLESIGLTCEEVGISVDDVVATRQRGERELFRKEASRWDPRLSKKNQSES